MKQMEILAARAALKTVRESELLLIHLRISINSLSSENDLIEVGLKGYLKRTKRTIYVQIMFGLLRIAKRNMTAFILKLHGRLSKEVRSQSN